MLLHGNECANSSCCNSLVANRYLPYHVRFGPHGTPDWTFEQSSLWQQSLTQVVHGIFLLQPCSAPEKKIYMSLKGGYITGQVLSWSQGMCDPDKNSP